MFNIYFFKFRLDLNMNLYFIFVMIITKIHNSREWALVPVQDSVQVEKSKNSVTDNFVFCEKTSQIVNFSQISLFSQNTLFKIIYNNEETILYIKEKEIFETKCSNINNILPFSMFKIFTVLLGSLFR